MLGLIIRVDVPQSEAELLLIVTLLHHHLEPRFTCLLIFRYFIFHVRTVRAIRRMSVYWTVNKTRQQLTQQLYCNQGWVQGWAVVKCGPAVLQTDQWVNCGPLKCEP